MGWIKRESLRFEGSSSLCVVVEFGVGETLDAVWAEENSVKLRPRRDQVGRLKTVKPALYGRIGRKHARRMHATAQLTGHHRN